MRELITLSQTPCWITKAVSRRKERGRDNVRRDGKVRKKQKECDKTQQKCISV